MYVWIAGTLDAISYKDHTQLSLMITRKSCEPTKCNFLNDGFQNQGILILIIKET